MPAWAKIVLRSVGTLNAVLAVLGFYWLVFFVHNVLARARPDPYAPYFGISFAVMTAINIAFLALFLTAAFRLFRLKNSGIIMHSITSASLIAYGILNGTLWLAGRGVGKSIGAATGVGNMGIAPFAVLFVVSYVYPIASTIVLLITRQRILPSLCAPDRVGAA